MQGTRQRVLKEKSKEPESQKSFTILPNTVFIENRTTDILILELPSPS